MVKTALQHRWGWMVAAGTGISVLASGCGGGGGGGTPAVDPLTKGLIHEWKFNNDATDSVGNLSATPVGPVTYAASPTGKGIVFNGSTTGINIQATADMQFQASFSLSAWAKLASYPDPSKLWATIIFDGDDRGGLDPYDIQVAPDGTLQFLTTSAAEAAAVNGPKYPLNTWQLVTATYDQAAGLQTLYVNGKQVGQNKKVTDLTPVVPLDATQVPGVGIGTNNGFPNSFYNMGWNGEISDLRVYDRALSAAEVLSLYKKGTVPK